MRDDFKAPVKRLLAERAGYRCSVCCKSTSGPAADSEAALSDGMAAHITAASKKGPRFNPALSPEQRRSAENGIWVCTLHGRQIDADSSAFSVDLLRGLKTIREEAAERALYPHGGPQDQSVRLIELPHTTTAFKLFEIVAPQPYTYPTTAAIRELVERAEQPNRLLDLAADVIPNIWATHANVAGILSTLLSTAVELWQPTDVLLTKLEELCETVIQEGDWSRVAAVEPLAFALGAKGHFDVHRRVLERLIEEQHWRNADATRTRKYYGTVGVEIAAIVRHWHDPFRKGLLRVNDIGRLIDLLLSADTSLSTPAAHGTVLDLLSAHAVALKECGEVALACRINELVTAISHSGKSGPAKKAMQTAAASRCR